MINRKLNLIDRLMDNSSIFIIGPRGVGKSQLIKETIKLLPSNSTLVIDLLNTTQFREFLKKPELLYQQVKSHLHKLDHVLVVIDEIQKIPELLNEVHRAIEDFKDKVQFILTGSSARKLKQAGVNLLAGRALSHNLHPFTIDEIDIDLESALQFGTLPLVYGAKNKVATLRSYVDTYLQIEVQQEALIRKLEPFIRFIELAAQFNGKQVNYSRIAKQVGTTAKTVIEYFSILQDTLLVRRIEPWSYSVIEQLAQSPRYYLFDCGVLNALSGELKTELRAGTGRYGNLFETFIINEIIRKNDYEELGNKLFYLRLHSGLEIDLIISKGPRDTPRLVEIKSKNLPDEADVKPLCKAKELFPDAELFCLAQNSREYQVSGVSVLPWREGIARIL